MWHRLREIAEEPAAQKAADLFAERFPRFEEAWEGLKWLLSRTPSLKGSARRSEMGREYWLYVCASDIFAETPEIWVLYSFDDDRVVIYGINAKESDKE